MLIQENSTFPTLKEISAWELIKNSTPQNSLCIASDDFQKLSLIKEAWDSMKEGSSQAIGSNYIMKNIERSLLEEYWEKFQICVFDDDYAAKVTLEAKNTVLINNVKMLFQKLARKLAVPIGFYDWVKLKNQWEEDALFQLWRNILLQLPNAPFLNTSQKIREWLELPKNAIQFNQVEIISTDRWNSYALPQELKYFTSLQFLELGYTNIRCIDLLCNLPNLKMISLESSCISRIPNEITSLKKLKTLGLNFSDITIIPELPPSIMYLSLADNNLWSLDSLHSLTNLRMLDISKNALLRPLLDNGILNSRKEVELILYKDKTFREYECIGNFSKFIKNTTYYFSIEHHDLIMKAYKTSLNERERASIFSLIDCNSCSLEVFYTAMLKAINCRFNGLSDSQKNSLNLKIKERDKDQPYHNILLQSDLMDEVIL